MSDKVQETIAERGKIYGDPYLSHVNIGLAWTGLIQQHYGMTLAHPLPASLVAAMLVDFKMSRAARCEAPHHADNFLDAHAYVGFGEEFQKKEKSSLSVTLPEVLFARDPQQWFTFGNFLPKVRDFIRVRGSGEAPLASGKVASIEPVDREWRLQLAGLPAFTVAAHYSWMEIPGGRDE